MKFSFFFSFLIIFGQNFAEAKYFRCDFTEPFFELIISTENKIVTYVPAFLNVNDPSKGSVDGTFSKNIKVNSIKMKANQILINKNIIISNNIIGSNGMSEHSYPYMIEYIDEAGVSNFGGCESEDKHYSTTVSRIASFDNFGLTMVNYWPGEYGHVTGFKATKDAIVPTSATYVNIEKINPDNDMKECKITKGKMFIPSLGKKGEIFATIFKTRKFVAQVDFQDRGGDERKIKKGDIFYELAYASEGYCVVERNGKVDTMFCPGNAEAINGKPLFQEVDFEGKPIVNQPDNINTSKEYVYTKCEDGHWTWISSEYLANSKEFESAYDPSLDDEK